MLKRRDTLLLIGVVMLAIGVMLFVTPLQSNVWILGPIFFYFGGSLVFVGTAIHFFG
jgi:hypothetical protein